VLLLSDEPNTDTKPLSFFLELKLVSFLAKKKKTDHHPSLIFSFAFFIDEDGACANLGKVCLRHGTRLLLLLRVCT
jgi:hypothetical protein